MREVAKRKRAQKKRGGRGKDHRRAVKKGTKKEAMGDFEGRGSRSKKEGGSGKGWGEGGLKRHGYTPSWGAPGR